jgi:hypothetical protein
MFFCKNFTFDSIICVKKGSADFNFNFIDYKTDLEKILLENKFKNSILPCRFLQVKH